MITTTADYAEEQSLELVQEMWREVADQLVSLTSQTMKPGVVLVTALSREDDDYRHTLYIVRPRAGFDGVHVHTSTILSLSESPSLPTLGDLIKGPGNMKAEPLIWDEFYKVGVPRHAELVSNRPGVKGEELFEWAYRTNSLTEGNQPIYHHRLFVRHTDGAIVELHQEF